MAATKRWMQIVGAFYVLQFTMMAFVRAPIRALGPAGALEQADAGNPIARFLVDTWVIFGLEVGGIGVALLLASRAPQTGRSLIGGVIAVELSRGILADVWYAIARGDHGAVTGIWLVIHTAIIVTGILVMRRDGALVPREERGALPERA
jgi:hypothetical protein